MFEIFLFQVRENNFDEIKCTALFWVNFQNYENRLQVKDTQLVEALELLGLCRAESLIATMVRALSYPIGLRFIRTV